jgi:cell surface protein (putative)
MSLISRLHHVLEGRPKDQYVELKTTTPMDELKHIANLDGLSNDRLKFVERLEDGEYGLLDMGENIFYRTAKDVERGFETYSGTIMTFEDPEVKKWLVANIGGEQGITNGIYGKVGVRGVAGEVTYEQALAAEDVSIPNNKSIRRFNELVYFKNLKKFTFVNSSIEEISLPYISIGVNGPFYNCTKLRKLTTRYGLDISGSNFLRSCSTLSDLDTSRWTFSGSSTERMFEGCKSITNLDLRNLGMDTVVDSNSMFSGCSSLQTLDTSKWNLGNLNNGQSMFLGCSSLQTLDTSKWNLGNLNNGQSMFLGCSSLQTLDTSKWNLGNLNTAERMFSQTNINTLDVKDWDLRKLTNTVYMFFQTPLISLDTSGWVLNNLSNAALMFENCSNLITLGNTSGWGLEKLTNATAMFHLCRSLQSLDTSGWNLENVTTTAQMFDTCMALTTLGDTSRWNLIRCTNMQNQFVYCDQLTKVDLTYTSTPLVAVSNLTNVFLLNTGNLESIVGDHTETDNVSVFNGYNSTEFNISNLRSLNLASILAIIRGLGTNRARKRFVLSRDFDKSRIPQEYKTMLENKNWELA